MLCFVCVIVSMCRFDTDQPHVFKFSDLTRNIYLTGQVEGINIVRGEVMKILKHSKLYNIMTIHRTVQISLRIETCGMCVVITI